MHACELNLRNIMILMIALTSLQLLHAQDDCEDECKVNDQPCNDDQCTRQLDRTGRRHRLGYGCRDRL